MKKIFLFLFSLFITTMAFAYTAEIDGIYYYFYSYVENKTATVTYESSNKYSGDIIIPEKVSYDGVEYSVTEIGISAFKGCTGLTSIEIPNSVTEIGDEAFYGCTGLTTIEIPNSVTEIGGAAFYGCTGLTSIEIPNSVTSIGSSAFYGCTGLTSIEMPNSVTEIGYYAFYGCTGLTSVTIGSSVTSIGDKAFYGCTGLTSIEMPNSVTYIGISVFRGCSNLTSVVWNSVYCYYSSIKYVDHLPFGNTITSFVFGDSVEYIPEYLCYGMDELTSITIPNSVISIGRNVFENCSSLSSIKWNAKKCNNFTFEKRPFVATNLVTSFVFGDSVEHVPTYLCYGMNNITSITIPNGVTSIGGSAFDGCTGLASVIIGNDVTEIGDYAFYSCDKLRTVEIGNSLETIGSHAFSGCTAIYSISIDAIIPPIVESSTFSSVSRTAQIKVPCNAVAAYQASTYWNEFTNYIESPYSLSIKVNDNSMGIAVIIKQNSCTDVTAQVQAQALPGYEFVKWSDGFTENPHTLFVTENMTITAEFRKIGEEPEDKPGEEEKHNNFIVESADKTQGAVEITITAEAIEGFEFDHWSDGSTENPRVVTLDADVELYAYFRVAGTGLENSVISSANVYGNNGTLYVEGAETDYHVLDMAGRLIYTGRDAQLQLPCGVYMVAIGGEVQKVVI